MGLLVGLPLKLFHMLFVLLRLAWPVLLILLVLYLVRRRKRTAEQGTDWREPPKEPKFHGPVYTVDYEEVDDSEEPK